MTITKLNLWKCDFCNKEETHPDNGIRPKHWRIFELQERDPETTRLRLETFACCPTCGGPGSLYETMPPIRRLLHKIGVFKQ